MKTLSHSSNPSVPRTVRELGDGLADRQYSAVELVEHCLQRIDATTESVRAFVEVFRSSALQQAKESDERHRAGRPLSPIDGIPFAVKDIIGIQGRKMSAGSRSVDIVPASDASIISRLRSAGGIILGTTRMHELAYGPSGLNDFDGGARNPRFPGIIPGGSSSGSAAAVAAGLSPIALGSDTGGSVRAPATLCGIVGFKPSYDLLPIAGVHPTAPTLDHLGFLTSSVEDVRIAMNVFAGMPLTEEGLHAGRRLAVFDDPDLTVDPAIATALSNALDALSDRGWRVESVTAPSGFDVMDVSTTIMAYEAYRVNRERLETVPELLGADVRERLEDGARTTRDQYEHALGEVDRVRTEMSALAAPFDALVNATIPITGPSIEAGARPDVRRMLMRNTRLQNLLGVPAISLPGDASGPAPWGIQLFARRGRDAALLASAAAVASDLEG
ncbi:Asp-tRNA(Asn)/Glu-tRNA(Gln) amidotransferase A subunit family amidase [Streptomyces sp. SAI-133]|uniref:amidase n=1 Tax=Streptomyces sp. SAI-133 TaxID=2940547 RepID=UPI002473E4A0|nr:amidase [Streptomyces sp. SAI-133]MDH6581572.1 Asp-tRNA(Asn)/Glu-tRNA(Gln) amidotransferase A subunit family amidase [Streptomyces sp. SAI-133]